jgi:N-acetylglucosaminyl-diphospho-decaprenol L-rhamnosyltransferase
MSSVPGVSIIIVSFETCELTLRAVQSALGSMGGGEVIVVDNASTDGTSATLQRLDEPRLTVEQSHVNGGFGVAANRGAHRAKEPILMFLNSDAELSRESLALLVDEVVSRDGRCLAGPRLVDTTGATQRSAGLIPQPSDLVIRALGLYAVARAMTHVPVISRLILRSRIAREYSTAETATGPVDTSMVGGACFAIGREVFLDLGGFDEQFFMYFEDADLCRRATKGGIPIHFVPEAIVRHIGGGSSSEDYHFGPMHARSMRQYLAKWYGAPGASLALALLSLRLIGFALTLRPSTGRAWAALRAAARR